MSFLSSSLILSPSSLLSFPSFSPSPSFLDAEGGPQLYHRGLSITNAARIHYANPTISLPVAGPYICDNGHAEVSHVGDDLTVLWRDLGMLDEFV